MTLLSTMIFSPVGFELKRTLFAGMKFGRMATLETSVKLGELEQQGAPHSENVALLTKAFATLGQPY